MRFVGHLSSSSALASETPRASVLSHTTNLVLSPSTWNYSELHNNNNNTFDPTITHNQLNFMPPTSVLRQCKPFSSLTYQSIEKSTKNLFNLNDLNQSKSPLIDIATTIEDKDTTTTQSTSLLGSLLSTTRCSPAVPKSRTELQSGLATNFIIQQEQQHSLSTGLLSTPTSDEMAQIKVELLLYY